MCNQSINQSVPLEHHYRLPLHAIAPEDINLHQQHCGKQKSRIHENAWTSSDRQSPTQLAYILRDGR